MRNKFCFCLLLVLAVGSCRKRTGGTALAEEPKLGSAVCNFFVNDDLKHSNQLLALYPDKSGAKSDIHLPTPAKNGDKPQMSYMVTSDGETLVLQIMEAGGTKDKSTRGHILISTAEFKIEDIKSEGAVKTTLNTVDNKTRLECILHR